MSNIAIFKQPNSPANTGRRELSELAKSLVGGGATNRRIQTNTNGTFKRIVNGEQIGKAPRGEINVIIINTLPKVSRVFYAGKYDPNAKATLPNCWSNLGDKPEAGASDPQARNCGECPQNVAGSGDNGGRACRFQRRIAVLLEGDDSGDIYQFNIPAKSLFGKGSDNVHPFESYTKYLPANGFSIDQVVTTISYDSNADSMELLFSPVRETSDEEMALVSEAQANPDRQRVCVLTVAQSDKVEKLPAPTKPEVKAKAKVVRSAEPDEDEEEDVPVVRQSSKPPVKAAPAAKGNLAKSLSDWDEDEED